MKKFNKVPFKCHSNDGTVVEHKSLKEAVAYSESNSDIWKISFDDIFGSRVRLIRIDGKWIMQNFDTVIKDVITKRIKNARP